MKRLTRSFTTLFACLGLLTFLPGCAWSIGDKEGTEGIKTVRPTKGQELSDLKRAYEQGAVSEQEYKDQRQRILDRD